MKSTRLITMALSAAALFAQENPITSPPEGWMRYGLPITMDTSRRGFPNWAFERYTVDSQSQHMDTVLNLIVYKNAVPTRFSRDYYLITGPFRHAVTGSGSNLLSIGWFGKEMFLKIEGKGIRMWDAGPKSTVGETTNSFSVGSSISAADAGVNFAYSVSNSMPDVKFSSTVTNYSANLKAELPGGNKPASLSGYSYTSAVIVEVEEKAGVTISITAGSEWSYNYPRGTEAYRTRTWSSGIYDLDFTDKLIKFNFGLCAGIRGGLAQSGQPVELQPCTGTPAQRWSYTLAGQFRATLTAGDTPLCLDADGLTPGVGSPMVLSPCSDLKRSQKFQSRQVWFMGQDTTYAKGVYYDCNIYSPSSFTVVPTECSAYPTNYPLSRQVHSDLGYVVGPGTSNVSGTQLSMQLPRPNTLAIIPGTPHLTIVANSFLTIQ